MSILRFIKWIDEGAPFEIFGDGSQARDFTYIDDIAEGTILLPFMGLGRTAPSGFWDWARLATAHTTPRIA